MVPAFCYLSLFLVNLLRAEPAPAPREPFFDARLTRFGSREGIEELSFHSICQDQRGFLWFASQHGLVRFDGNQFKTYKNQPEQETSLSNNFIWQLVIDAKNRLWVVTMSGLDLYNPSLDSFSHFKLPQSMKFADLTCDAQGRLIFACNTGLLVLDPDKQAEPILHSAAGALYRLFIDSTQRVWAAATDEVLTISPDTGEITPVEGLEILNDAQTIKIAQESEHIFWFATLKSGLVRYDESTRETQVFTLGHNPLSNAIDTCFVDAEGNVWAGANQSIYCKRVGQAQFARLVDESLFDSLGQARIKGIFQDRSGSLWFGAYGQGLLRFNPNSMQLGHHRKNRLQPGGLPSNDIRAFAESAKGDLWIATAGGLAVLDAETGVITDQNQLLFPKEQPGMIMALAIDQSDNLWALTDNHGLRCYDFSKHKLKIHTPDANNPNLPIDLLSEAILLTRAGQLWVGTSIGLALFQPESGDFINKPVTADTPLAAQILCMSEDQAGNILIGTFGDGLYVFDVRSERSVHYSRAVHGLTENNVSAVLHDEKKRLWVATTRNLNLLPRGADRFRSFGPKEGLPSNMVYCMRTDDNGIMWMGTTRGLVRFDPETEKFRTLTIGEGIQENEFNTNACLKLKDGRLAFGGVNGFNLFAPSKVVIDYPRPSVVYTNFLLRNDPVPIDPAGPLPYDVGHMQRIVLNPMNREFGFEFASPGALDAQQMRYLYKLEGFDNTWLPTRANQYQVVFTNLASGTYRLHVKAAYPISEFGPESVVEIAIRPAFWRTNLAYGLYIAACLGLIYGLVIHLRRRGQNLERLVSERTRMLALRNRELRALDQMVATINQTPDPDLLMGALVDRIRHEFPGAERVSCLLTQSVRKVYKLVAYSGAEPETLDQTVAVAELDENLSKHLERAAEGVYLGHAFRDRVRKSLFPGPVPASVVVLEIGTSYQREGYLIIDNQSDPEAFKGTDVETLLRVRLHTMNALSKVRTLRDLTSAQRELAESAHGAGVADLAVEVLHHLGVKMAQMLETIEAQAELLEDDNTVMTLIEVGETLSSAEQAESEDRSLPELVKALGEQWQEAVGLIYDIDKQCVDISQIIHAQLEVGTEERHASRPLDLNLFIGEILRSEPFKFLVDEVRLTSEFALNEPVLADALRLRRVLIHVIENAWEARVGSSPRLLLQTRKCQNIGQFILTDNGVGVEPELLKEVFAPGFSTKSAKRGLGLYYCAMVLEHMGGTISLESEGSGLGTIVYISLPLNPSTILSGIG